MSGFVGRRVGEGMGRGSEEKDFELGGREVRSCDKKGMYGRKNVDKKFLWGDRRIYMGFYLVVGYVFYNFGCVRDCMDCK